jgi:hypothetical protein
MAFSRLQKILKFFFALSLTVTKKLVKYLKAPAVAIEDSTTYFEFYQK